MTNAIEITDVTVERDGRFILDKISFNIPPGSCTVLVGPNGCGKTTLIRAIAGLIKFKGSITLSGQPISAINTRELASIRAYAPQEPVFPAEMPVHEFVELGCRSRNATTIRNALERCRLREFEHRKLGSLSGGEKRRAGLAQTLAQETPIVLLDEPTTALDIGHQQSVLDLVDQARRELGTTFLMAMHDLTLASQYATHVAFLDHGKLVDFGTPTEVLRIESLEKHYGTSLTVLSDETTLAIVPKRASS